MFDKNSFKVNENKTETEMRILMIKTIMLTPALLIPAYFPFLAVFFLQTGLERCKTYY